MKNNKRVLVVATSSNTRGGITAVIKAHQKSLFWKEWNCIWIETHIDKSFFTKLFYFIKSFIKYLYLIKKTTLVHFHASGPMSVRRKYPFLVIAKLLRIPVIIHFHAFSAESQIPNSHKKLYRNFFELGDEIIVLSESWKTGILKDFNFAPDNIKVIYNPCS